MRIRELRSAPLEHDLRPRRATLVVGVLLVAVPWVFLALTDTRLTSLERSTFDAVNGLPDIPRVLLDALMWFGTLGGAVVVAVVAGVVVRRVAPAASVALAAWAAYVLAQIAKSLVDRGRPVAFLADPILRAHAPGSGFPSGHAAVAAAVAAALVPWLGRRGRVLAWVTAAGVAVARVYAGVHLPLDVVGGSGIGIVCGTLAAVAVGTPGRSVDPVA